MGIQGFTKLFPAEREIKLRSLRGKHVAIDAMAEIHRCSLGCATTHTLTDANGRPTIHISSLLLGVIFKLQSYGIHQYWVFDRKFDDTCTIEPLKELELKKRSEARTKAKKKINDLKSELLHIEQNKLFSSDDEDDQSTQIKMESHRRSIEKYEKRCFRVQSYHIQDVQFMLDCLNIPWVVAPFRLNGNHSDPYEAEQFAAMLTNETRYGIDHLIDYVMSPDADAIMFGSKRIIKRVRQKGKANKFVEYDLDNLLSDNGIDLDDLIKIGLILGTDFAEKTPGIGAKSIFKKIPKTKLKNKKYMDDLRRDFPGIRDIENAPLFRVTCLSDRQRKARDEIFKKEMTDAEIDSIVWHNADSVPFEDEGGRDRLLDWLSSVKGFNRARIERLLNKVLG